jgi:hypothetical protein
MTTYVSAATARGLLWSTTLTTAAFRTVCTQIKAALDGCGLVQTSDTGQLDPATVALPGSSNSDGGYWIYRFNDALQGSAPVFLKVIPGRGASLPATRVRIEVGTGTNGAGVISGTAGATKTPILTCGDTYVTPSADPVATTYAIHIAGFAALVYAAIPEGRNDPPRHWFTIQRTTDPDTGDLTGEGILLHLPHTNPTTSTPAYYLNFSTGGPSGTTSTSFVQDYVLPLISLNDLPGGEKAAWPHMYLNNGVVRQAWATWTCAASALSSGVNTFDASPYGVSARWLGVGDGNGRAMRGETASSTPAEYALVIRWEA